MITYHQFFIFFFFFFNDTATTEIYTLSLHDALPISRHRVGRSVAAGCYRRSTIRRRSRNGDLPMSVSEMSTEMRAKSSLLTFAAIGDLHVKEVLREERTSRLRELFAEISTKADVLVLCGDLTDVGKPREAEILAEDLHACSIPVVGVLGNHDYESGQVEEVKNILKAAGMHVLNGQSYERNGVACVGVRGFLGGFCHRVLASFGVPVVKDLVAEAMSEAMCLENAMRAVHCERAVVVLHYAPVQDTVEGEPPEIFPFLGSSRLGETIDRFEVSAVVHGHAHHGRYLGRTPRGAPVYNVAAGIEKPTGRPYALIKV